MIFSKIEFFTPIRCASPFPKQLSIMYLTLFSSHIFFVLSCELESTIIMSELSTFNLDIMYFKLGPSFFEGITIDKFNRLND